MSGSGTDIYFIGIVLPLLLAVMITLIMLAARDSRSGHSQPDSRATSGAGGGQATRDEDPATRAGRTR
jgi:hypothetical protein